jgi:hypothetical protein
VSGVSQTPTYDQLRGERINADVPASDVDVPAGEADLDPNAHVGKHRLRGYASTAVAVSGLSLGSGVDLAEDWAGFGTSDSDHPVKHWLRDDAPGAAGVCGPAPGLGADLAESWSWFGTGEPGSVDPANSARGVHCSAGSPGRGHISAANEQGDADQPGLPGQGPHALFPSPAHACDT